MGLGHAEAVDGFALEVEFDQDNRLLSHDPSVMSRLDGHNLRRFMLDDATVGVLDVNFALREEADMRVHAEVRSDDRLHVDGPAESCRIDHSLDPRRAGAADLEPNVADRAALRAPDRGDERVRLGPVAWRAPTLPGAGG